MEDKLLEVKHLSKRFSGVKALNDVSFSLDRGEVACLVGENGSGKSTIIKIISGVYNPDEGDLAINGRHYDRLTPIASIREGIHVIYQDFSLFPNLTVAENIAVDHLISSGERFVNWRQVNEIAREGLSKVRVEVDLDSLVETVTTADQQIIAITKALLQDARLIIMDEPTTALTEREIRYLFEIIGDLKKKGISILFVSHKLNEIKQISEHTLILRNGEKVFDERTRDLDIPTMTFYMTGRTIDTGALSFSLGDENALPLLRVEKLTAAPYFFDITFQLKPGEVLGITGVLGSGRSEVALSLFGALPAMSGKVYLEGNEEKLRSISDAVARGIGYVPEDRIREGLFLEQSISNNLIVRVIHSLINKIGLLLDKRKEQKTDEWLRKLDIKTPTSRLPASSLSGGNQQRLVLGKWLASNPKILLLNAPTVGVDVGSKADLHGLIRELTRAGMGIILVSDDVPELLQTCNRVLLMREGRIAREFVREMMNEQELSRELISEQPAEVKAVSGESVPKARPAHRKAAWSKKVLARESIVFLLIVMLAVLVGARNAAFLSLATLFDVVRSTIPNCILALGVLMVLISGGVDISFVAIAAMTSFGTHLLLLHFGYNGGIALYFVIARLSGSGCGFSRGLPNLPI